MQEIQAGFAFASIRVYSGRSTTIERLIILGNNTPIGDWNIGYSRKLENLI